MRRTIFTLVALIFAAGMLAAQTSGGQFCLRAFEDRNSSGTLDSGEPFLTRGVSANLLNADNLVIASALMDDSPNAAQGVICFQFLEAGQYSLQITSAEFEPVTPDTFTASISEGTLPTVVEYGARRFSAETAPSTTTPVTSASDQRDTLARVVISALGALVVMAAMTVFGALIYLLAFRRQPAPALQVPPMPAPDYRKTPTGSMPAVRDIDTSEIKPVE